MATFTDNLDGTAGALLSARSGWSRPVGADDLPIDTSGSGVQLANGVTAAFTFHAPDSQPAGNDQYVEAILGVTSGYPMCVRAAISGGVLGQAYIGRRDASARFRLYHRSAANALTLIGSSTAFTSANADANPFRLEAVGDQLTVYFMGSVLIGPITNASSPSGQVGIFTRAGTLTTFAGVDNWGSGDVGAGATTHDATGALAGDPATVDGVADRTGAAATHDATGALTGGASAIAGVSARGGANDATGALVGDPAAIAGTASVKRIHDAAGALAGLQAAISGAASKRVTHAASGVMIGGPAEVAGYASLVLPFVPSFKFSQVRSARSGGASRSAISRR